MLTLPFHHELDKARSVIIAGAGGGFDIFSGLPLYFALRHAGKTVHLANLTFSNIPYSAGQRPVRELVEVLPDSSGSENYFPERHLSQWFADRGQRVPVWCIERFGHAAVARAYRALNDIIKPDTIILVDGGTDSLMRGDESGLGTPVEDSASIAAVAELANVERKMLCCLGFGVDAYHDVSHVDVLESIAVLARAGAYLGALSLTSDMPEVEQFRQATQYVLDKMPQYASIVCTSILAAIKGYFGDHHSADRTAGSELFINPLMPIYWCFRLDAVARRILYLSAVQDCEGFFDAERAIKQFRVRLASIKPRRPMPL